MSSRKATQFPAGAVTRVSPPPAGSYPAEAPPPPPAPDRGPLRWFVGTGAVIVVAGLVTVLVMVLNGRWGGGDGLLSHHDSGPQRDLPPLARLCPPPTAGAPSGPPARATPDSGPRTVDEDAGISYRAYGPPWKPWPLLWTAGSLEVPYGTGQHIVTETYQGGEYHASILSGAVPATVNDSYAIDIDCVGRQVVADVRVSYYPQPNTLELIREGPVRLGGLPAWLSEFRLHFDQPGLSAKDELVAVALLDVGRPTAAVLYVSIPGTHRQFDWVVEDVLASVRPN